MTGWDNAHEAETEAVHFLTLTIKIYPSRRKLHHIEELSYFISKVTLYFFEAIFINFSVDEFHLYAA